jgi:HECT-domain (ubiquitin-transferase)
MHQIVPIHTTPHRPTVGEGVDDHGGPYRAALHTAVGEEPNGFLELLTPCMNAKSDSGEILDPPVTLSSNFLRYDLIKCLLLLLLFLGENRDQTVLNPEFVQNAERLPLYNYFGKLLAIACRHSIMVPLSLPDMVWKPLVGETLKITDLKAIDVHTVRSLGEIAQGRVPHGQAVELLTQALLSSPLCPSSGLFASHSVAAAAAIKIFISPPHPEDRTGTGGDRGTGGGGGEGSAVRDALSQERIRSICDLLLHTHLTAQTHGIEQLSRGIGAVLPTEVFPMFTAAELRAVFCGQPEVDLEVLKKATVYEGGVAATDRLVLHTPSLRPSPSLSLILRSKTAVDNYCSCFRISVFT